MHRVFPMTHKSTPAAISPPIFMLLIRHGAILTDPLSTFCLYINNLGHCRRPFNEELFTYILDHITNLNTNFCINFSTNFYSSQYTILETIVGIDSPKLLILCLQYGADPCINNHAPLTQAIRYNRLELIKILLDAG